jgi:uncharacterized protein
MTRRINAYFVCGGRYHDFDFARLELLALLHPHERIRCRVAEDYSDLEAIRAADFLLTYTVDVCPDQAQQAALDEWLAAGKRWFALHGTNSIIEWTERGYVKAPRTAPRFMQMLGSQFVAHPPLGPFEVQVSAPEHPLVAGLGRFTVSDELYLAELHGPNEVLLHTHYNGKAQKGFVESDWFDDAPRPVMYLHRHGAGEVLYLTLGHCRGRLDMQPLVEDYPTVERASWESPVYRELLARGVRWAARLDADAGARIPASGDAA